MTTHIILFAVIALICSLVYHSLRVDSLRAAIHLGLRRFVSFFLIALVFGAALQWFTRWL